MRKNIVVVFDCDDVLYDYRGSLAKHLCKSYGYNVTKEDLNSWDLSKILGCSNDDVERYIEGHNVPNIMYNVRPLPGAVEAVKMLHMQGKDLQILSSYVRNHATEEENQKLINTRKTVINIDFGPLFSKMYNLKLGEPKKPYLADIRPDFFIDDSPRHAQAVPEGTVGILMDCVHNRDFDEKSAGIPRVLNAMEAVKFINIMEKEMPAVSLTKAKAIAEHTVINSR